MGLLGACALPNAAQVRAATSPRTPSSLEGMQLRSIARKVRDQIGQHPRRNGGLALTAVAATTAIVVTVRRRRRRAS